jgi:hypothetical protein
MARRIPDLWKSKERDATRLYSLFLAHLQLEHKHERIVSASRQIRRYAARGPGLKRAVFTFGSEIDALCDQKQFKTAWRQLRLRDRILFGKQSIWKQDWAWNHAPLLYFLKRYTEGCALLEEALDVWFDGRNFESYDNLLFQVYNSDKSPWHRCRVTLSHFYRRLGKDLREWRHWQAFVDGFHPKLFRLVDVRRGELLADAGRLPVFFDRLLSIRSKRVPTRIGNGQADLIDNPAKVKKRQDAIRNRSGRNDERAKSKRERTNAKLSELFPELRDLLK